MNKKVRPEWYKWLIIVGVIWGIKSYLGFVLVLVGIIVWVYKKRKR